LSTARPADQLAIDESVLELLSHVIRTAYSRTRQISSRRRKSTRQSHELLVQRAKVLLASDFREPLSLDSIARFANSSPYHLPRVFKKETGLSIHRYLNRLRLRMALELIGDSDLARVALDVGFSSHSHFSDAFRREFGISPSRMRRIATIRTIREISKNLIV